MYYIYSMDREITRSPIVGILLLNLIQLHLKQETDFFLSEWGFLQKEPPNGGEKRTSHQTTATEEKIKLVRCTATLVRPMWHHSHRELQNLCTYRNKASAHVCIGDTESWFTDSLHTKTKTKQKTQITDVNTHTHTHTHTLSLSLSLSLSFYFFLSLPPSLPPSLGISA